METRETVYVVKRVCLSKKKGFIGKTYNPLFVKKIMFD